jgi:REP element-mobilizing transposase RayT
MILPNTFYHIYNHANGHDNLFKEAENYRFFLQQYGKYVGPVADTYAYCLMPNHFHFLLKTKSYPDLQGLIDLEGLGAEKKERFFSQQFSNFFNSYCKAFNKKYNRRGSMFMKNLRRRVINDQADFLNVLVYIHRNPIKHGFTNDIQDWPMNSFHHYFKDNKLEWLRTKTVEPLFDSKKEFTDLHRAAYSPA